MLPGACYNLISSVHLLAKRVPISTALLYISRDKPEPLPLSKTKVINFSQKGNAGRKNGKKRTLKKTHQSMKQWHKIQGLKGFTPESSAPTLPSQAFPLSAFTLQLMNALKTASTVSGRST